MISNIIFLIISGIYLHYAYVQWGWVGLNLVGGYLIVDGLIMLAGYVLSPRKRHFSWHVSGTMPAMELRPSPAFLFRVMAWVFLVLPPIVYFVIWLPMQPK